MKIKYQWLTTPIKPHPFHQIPIVDSELRKQAGENEGEGEKEGDDKPKSSRLVTADGTYISQSVFSTVTVKKDEKM